ncbi:hypothetical protein ACNPM4_03205 [Microbacterium sp. AGC62]
MSVSESRLDDYRIEADERVAEVVELIPEEFQPSPVQVHASRALVDGMAADGWEHERVRETSESQLVTEGFHRDDWYVEVVWVTAASGLHEAIDIRVLSPKTVRGDHDEIRS